MLKKILVKVILTVFEPEEGNLEVQVDSSEHIAHRDLLVLLERIVDSTKKVIAEKEKEKEVKE